MGLPEIKSGSTTTSSSGSSSSSSSGSSSNSSIGYSGFSSYLNSRSMELRRRTPSRPCPTVSMATLAVATRPITPAPAARIPVQVTEAELALGKNFKSNDQVAMALGKLGLESSKLIFGVDFSKSNEWTGKRSLHAVGGTPNPYCQIMSIIGKIFAFMDGDNSIPCFGFGNATTEDKGVFSFHTDCSPCHGYEGALLCYNSIVPHLVLAGPTSYAPIIDAAISVVEKSGGRYHVLVIITDGQVTRSVNASDGELSPQEKETINSIVNASSYPLSILVVGVGDGPWEGMNKIINKIPARKFNHYEFVNFTDIMSKESTPSKKEIAFALAALKGIPNQKNAASELGLLGRVTGKAKMIYPRPPTVPYTNCPAFSVAESSSRSTPTPDERNWLCPICCTKWKDMAFGCGHMTCKECGPELTSCPICRKPIHSRLRLYL